MAKRTFRTPHKLDAGNAAHHDRSQQPDIRAVVPAVNANKLSVRIRTEASQVVGCAEECVLQGRQHLLLVVGQECDSNPVLQWVRYVRFVTLNHVMESK
jgi:hypothetical protein